MREGLRLKKEEVDKASFWVDLCATCHEHESEEEQTAGARDVKAWQVKQGFVFAWVDVNA